MTLGGVGIGGHVAERTPEPGSGVELSAGIGKGAEVSEASDRGGIGGCGAAEDWLEACGCEGCGWEGEARGGWEWGWDGDGGGTCAWEAYGEGYGSCEAGWEDGCRDARAGTDVCIEACTGTEAWL